MYITVKFLLVGVCQWSLRRWLYNHDVNILSLILLQANAQKQRGQQAVNAASAQKAAEALKVVV